MLLSLFLTCSYFNNFNSFFYLFSVYRSKSELETVDIDLTVTQPTAHVEILSSMKKVTEKAVDEIRKHFQQIVSQNPVFNQLEAAAQRLPVVGLNLSAICLEESISLRQQMNNYTEKLVIEKPEFSSHEHSSQLPSATFDQNIFSPDSPEFSYAASSIEINGNSINEQPGSDKIEVSPDFSHELSYSENSWNTQSTEVSLESSGASQRVKKRKFSKFFEDIEVNKKKKERFLKSINSLKFKNNNIAGDTKISFEYKKGSESDSS